MELFVESLVMAGIDRDRIEKARHRGIAYQCLRCLEKDGTRTVNIKCRMEDHILRKHMEMEEIPFRCRLCEFKCLKRDQIFSHIEHYSRHVTAAAKHKVTDHFQYLVESQNPHVFGPQDFKSLTPVESLLHFLGVVESSPNQTVTSPAVPSTGIFSTALKPISTTSTETTLESPAILSPPILTGQVLMSGPPSVQAGLQESVPMGTGLSEAANQLTTLLQSTPATFRPIPTTAAVAMMGSPALPRAHMSTGQVPECVTTFGHGGCQVGVGQPEVASQLTSLLQSMVEIGQKENAAEKPLDLSTKASGKIDPPVVDNTDETTLPRVEPVEEYSPAEEGEGSDKESTYPPYIPTPIMRDSTAHEPESPIPEEEDILDLADDNMSISTPTKRTRETKDEETQKSKRPRSQSLPVDIHDISERTLVDLVGKALSAMERNRVVQEEMIKTMKDGTCVQAKLVEAVGKLRGAVEDLNRDNRRREERRRAFEDRWEDEWRREWNRRRDDDRKAETRRRETERAEREERRKQEEKKEERKQEEKKEEEAEKENSNRPRSTLGRLYTKNSVSDGSKRKSRN